ncbi:hypothetical protein AGMMS49938_11260 [Fibrobacterales bacterium]|nr:hypothetical protein AGMMS49938_11260 [Fibrobacterales bacterium]
MYNQYIAKQNEGEPKNAKKLHAISELESLLTKKQLYESHKLAKKDSLDIRLGALARLQRSLLTVFFAIGAWVAAVCGIV